ncbi:HIT family protein [Gordonia soli]|uniref:HIT domain-containing protein n=1 Tax=Gordonia soli NBRC 108243 TaxID=1223545 RepID=M0QDV5_9ACTN|nr:hypothetical protein [Gordonia soli]GAC66501.1 hypothetical protein GS4_02_02120 [Gordonia soli NBRC 108243]
MVEDWRADRIGSAIRGTNPTVIAELEAAFAVIGDAQFLPGYSLALTKTPGIDRLTDLPRPDRLAFLADVDLVAAAVTTVCGDRDPAFRRTNVEILGNTHAFLHAHIWPRYDWEPAHLVGMPVWLRDPAQWRDPETQLGPRHDAVRAELAAEIARLRATLD